MANNSSLTIAFKSGPFLLRSALWIGVIILVLGTLAVVWLNSQVNQIQQQTQKATALLLAQGLVNAITPAMITRDYAGLESRLVQTMANEQVTSALVIDLKGKVLSRVQRNTATGAPEPVFDPVPPQLPPNTSDNLLQHTGNSIVLWQRIEPGLSLGWLRIETQPTLVSTLLEATLNQITLIAVALASILLLVLGVVFFQAHTLFRTRENDLVEGNRLLEIVASQDAVTGLPNRRQLLEQLGRAVTEQHPQSLALCYLDLDEFKQINDSLGHEAGDFVLVEVAHRLLGCVRQGDLVVRLGGDEFVLLLHGIEDRERCEEILQRIVGSLSQPLWYRDQQVTISVSMGVALFPGDGQTADSLLDRADRAMYRAKRAGKNRWRWYQLPTQA
jgi:diguanylate cyclase (GGDEF)-like protein